MNSKNHSNTTAQKENQEKRVGGWLLFFCIILTIIRPSVQTFQTWNSYFEISTYLDYLPVMTVVAIVIELSISVLLIIFSIFAGVLLWTKKKDAVSMAQIYLSCELVLPMFLHVLYYMPWHPVSGDTEIIKVAKSNMFGNILFVGVFFIYLIKSKRVHATYNQNQELEGKSKNIFFLWCTKLMKKVITNKDANTKIHNPYLGYFLILIGYLSIAIIISISLIIVFQKNLTIESNKIFTLSPGMISGAILAGLSGLAYLIIRYGKRLRMEPGTKILKKDHRPPIVYLRSFILDGSSDLINQNIDIISSGLMVFGLSPDYKSFEEKIACTLKEFGPFVAIGNPEEHLPELGANRIYASDEEWQDEILRLSKKAQIIILGAGITKGFIWELEQVIKSCSPSRVLLFLPFNFFSGKKKRDSKSKAYNEFCKLANSILPHPLPKYHNYSTFMRFDTNWKPIPIKPYRSLRKVVIEMLKRTGVNTPKKRGRFIKSLVRIFFGVMIVVIFGIVIIFLVFKSFDLLN